MRCGEGKAKRFQHGGHEDTESTEKIVERNHNEMALTRFGLTSTFVFLRVLCVSVISVLKAVYCDQSRPNAAAFGLGVKTLYH